MQDIMGRVEAGGDDNIHVIFLFPHHNFLGENLKVKFITIYIIKRRFSPETQCGEFQSFVLPPIR
jgi:hypothetical protein